MLRTAAAVGGLAAALGATAAGAQGISATGVWDCRIELMLLCPADGADEGGCATQAEIYEQAFALDLDRGLVVHDTDDGLVELEIVARIDVEDRAQSLLFNEYSQMMLISQVLDDTLTVMGINVIYTPPISDEVRIGHCRPR